LRHNGGVAPAELVLGTGGVSAVGERGRPTLDESCRGARRGRAREPYVARSLTAWDSQVEPRGPGPAGVFPGGDRRAGLKWHKPGPARRRLVTSAQNPSAMSCSRASRRSAGSSTKPFFAGIVPRDPATRFLPTRRCSSGWRMAAVAGPKALRGRVEQPISTTSTVDGVMVVMLGFWMVCFHARRRPAA